jgi:hypothetical protein
VERWRSLSEAESA